MIDIDKGFSQGRSLSGKLTQQSNFVSEVSRLLFLIENLKEDDLNWGAPYKYIKSSKRYLINIEYRTVSNEIEVLQDLYSALVSIHSQILSFDNYEIDPWWKYKLEAAGNHLFTKVLPCLSFEEQNTFLFSIPNLYKNINYHSDDAKSHSVQ
jgi:hypothetical protein